MNAMDAALLANMDRCPTYAPFFGALGCACSIVFTTFGAAYGTAKSANAIFASGILRPDQLIQNTSVSSCRRAILYPSIRTRRKQQTMLTLRT
jgi:hypothetical protein